MNASPPTKAVAYLDDQGRVVRREDSGNGGFFRVDGAVPDSWTPLFPRLALEPSEVQAVAKAVLDSACSVPAPYCGNAMDPVNDLRIVSGRAIERLRSALTKEEKRD